MITRSPQPIGPTIYRSRVLATTALFVVEEVEVRFDNGVTRSFERMREAHDRSVIIVPVTEEMTVLLVREFVAGLGQYVLKLPTGRVQPDESNSEAANRELQEEVGLGSRQIEHLHQIHEQPGYSNATTEVILARQLYPAVGAGDEPEPLRVEERILSDVRSLIASNEISDARSLAALWLATLHIGGPSDEK